MSPSDAANALTQRDWRNLGFFYDFNEEKREWHFIGSKAGLEKFRDILMEYSNNPKNDKKSEHNHYGPYMYLEIMTWDSPDIDNHCIRGTLADIKRLSGLIDLKLKKALPASSFTIREEYAKHAKGTLIFELREEGFDPASVDPLLK